MELEKFEETLTLFTKWVHKKKVDWMKSDQHKEPDVIIGVSRGSKYFRIWTEYYGQKILYCFVNSNNGDLLKGSWKAPVKNGIRGSLFGGENEWEKKFDWSGPKYLR